MTRIEQTDDMDLVRKVIIDPDVWEMVSEDGQSPDEFKAHSSEFSAWSRICRGQDTAGVILEQRLSLTEIKAHVAILKPYRGIGAFHAFRAYLRLFSEAMDSRINKLSIEIPAYNSACLRLAFAVGFMDEGINRDSIMKNGEHVSQIRLGITRGEAEKCLRL